MTKDLDVFVRPSVENAPRVVRALQRYGAPLHGLTALDFSVPGYILQVGGGFLRIDITTTIDGVDFDEASADRVDVDVDGLAVPFIGRAALLKNKRMSGRKVDWVDVRKLERFIKESEGPKNKAAKKKAAKKATRTTTAKKTAKKGTPKKKTAKKR